MVTHGIQNMQQIRKNYEETVISAKYIKCEVSRRELWGCQFTFFHCKYGWGIMTSSLTWRPCWRLT